MPKKEQAVEELAQENTVPTIKPTETAKVDLSKQGFTIIKTPLPENENIFDFLNRKGAAKNGEDFEGILNRLLVGLADCVQNKKYKNAAWDLMYEAYYLGYLIPVYCKGMKVVLHKLDNYQTFRTASNFDLYPYCAGCARTPRSTVASLLDLYVKSELWTNAEPAARKVFANIEAYRVYRAKL